MVIRILTVLLSLTSLFTFVSLANAQERDLKPIEVTVFAEGDSAVGVNGSCKYGADVPTQPLRFRQVSNLPADLDESIQTIPLKNGEVARTGNEYMPNSSGCVFVKTLQLERLSDYEVVHDDKVWGTLKSSTIANEDEILVVLTRDGVSDSSSGKWELPTPTALPVPTSTPWPTPPPVPAGKQDDGTYLVRGEVNIQGSCIDVYGGQIVVRDGSNNILGVTGLQSIGECQFRFDINVDESEFYQFTIDGYGTEVLTLEHLESLEWNVTLSFSAP